MWFWFKNFLESLNQGSKRVAKKGRPTRIRKCLSHELSGGMKQRVAFIRALLSKQNLLCLDEPFSALDEFTRLDMQKWLLSVWEKSRKSILFVTHSIEEALFLADRIYILSKRPTMSKKNLSFLFKTTK